MPDTEAYLATEVYYEVAAKAFDTQIEQIDQLDTKASTAYAAATGILAVFAALVTLAALPKSGGVHIAVLVCFGLACAVYVTVAVFLLLAYQVKKWTAGPDLNRVKQHSEHYEGVGVQAWLADVYATTVTRNKSAVDTKAERLNLGLYGLALEAFILVAALAISLFFA